MDGAEEEDGASSLAVSGGSFLMASHFIHIHRLKGSERPAIGFIHGAPTQINTGQSDQRAGRDLPAIT